ncbi:hypothetical protein GCM10011297_21810 [Bacterioplanes sanyensis]|uniref:DUF1513 domain-containing protein n=1 Tax=Bacterioplanes sanyensis TaxID=1249553 RepID=UPI001676DE24|nr:DUF1513 domain-containing protein [Bacterioplanes sanyensis]GGY48487.1 hypothetical protein GCM10011297_21810 [Bacterioplanes sanyensis]
MSIHRRQFLQLSCAAMAMSVAAASGVALAPRGQRLLVSGYRDQATETQFGILVVDTEGQIKADFRVPERVHIADLYPSEPSVLVNSRAPGAPLRRYDFAGQLQAHLPVPKDMHLEGHAVFSHNGQVLYASASDYRRGEGRLLVIDAQRLTLLDIWTTHGVGPHELVMQGDDVYLANTGVRTHPDSGRKALNIDSMHSELVKLDGSTGKLLQRWASPKQALSARHLDVLADGRVLVGCQYQRKDARPPCIAIASAGSEQLQLLEPDNDWLHWDMQGYTASVRAFPPTSARAGEAMISNPRGHLLSHWQGATPALQDTQAMQYAKGIALFGNQGWISAGAGELWHWHNDELKPLSESVKTGIWWENHLHGRVLAV